MKNSKLKLNADKTEFLFIGTSTQHAKTRWFFPPIHILNQSITPAASVLNLGVTFLENFNFKQHIQLSKTCRCCFFPYPRSSPYSPVYITFRVQN
ncbi:hypothetical protein NP493_204g05000 [Ridgeia piscesae]|uniref:Uncharacterized protein n=1 Tax=Ridgeia piscesae TaxID=27915 RepID=A0AAD9P131_RIDPI|nr:hypothetical protein NP493_204g05000 [Ridgeia piscesae]